MSEWEPSPGPPPALASDSEREQIVEWLRAASAEGRLTVDELTERAEAAYAARTRPELAAIVADIPIHHAPAAPAYQPPYPLVSPTAQPPAPVPAQIESHNCVLSSLRRDGRWVLSPRSRFTAILGSINLDLRDALIPSHEIDVEINCVLGSAEILVPEGVQVAVYGGGVMSSREVNVRGTPVPGAPLIRVHLSGLMGSVTVRSRPRFKQRLKEAAGF